MLYLRKNIRFALYSERRGCDEKILNDVDRVEEEMIQGLVKSAPKMLRKLDYGTIVVRADKKEGKVALVSGGGSGMNRLMPAMSARGCSMVPSPGRYSRRRHRTRF